MAVPVTIKHEDGLRLILLGQQLRVPFKRRPLFWTESVDGRKGDLSTLSEGKQGQVSFRIANHFVRTPQSC